MTLALSLHQPYASLVFARVKRHETRSFKPPASLLKAPWVLHAAKKPIGELDEAMECLCRMTFGPKFRDELPLGAGIGLVSITHSGRTSTHEIAALGADDHHAGDWSPGRFAWRLEVTEQFNEPIPARGKQGVWTWTS